MFSLSLYIASTTDSLAKLNFDELARESNLRENPVKQGEGLFELSLDHYMRFGATK